MVHNAVGIFLAHADGRDPARLDAFLAEHGDTMPRAAYRLANRKRR